MKVPDKIENMVVAPLDERVSLQLCNKKNEIIFESSGKWLYPLFEVEDYLHASAIDAEDLFFHDKIAGCAAASLISRMGFRRCFIDTVSRPAKEVFERFGVDCKYNLLVDRIKCRTEDLITSDMEIDEVYRMLCQRAGRLHGIDLEIRDLEAGYESKQILNGLNLSIRAGEQLVIAGDPGTGKSTLVKILIGALDIYGGEILLDGQPSEGGKEIPSQIGYVNQSIKTTDSSITSSDVVAFGLLGQKITAFEASYQIEIAMRRAGCFHLADCNIKTLSEGEKQRVSLARCLARKAGLILMDEPTFFLDCDSKNELLDVLKNVFRPSMPTVLLMSHDHDWIEKLGWQVCTLRDGKLL